MDKDQLRLPSLRGKGYDGIRKDLDLYVHDLEDRNKRLLEELKSFSKEGKIKELRDQLEHYYSHSIHTMSDKEKEDAKAFSDLHWETCKANTQYIIEGTGIGDAVTVRCKKCGKTENITDTDMW